MMRMVGSPSPPLVSNNSQQKDRKTVQNASSKVSVVVQRMLLPLLDHPGMASHVVFEAEPSSPDPELDLMQKIFKKQPDLMGDKDSFLEHAAHLFDIMVSLPGNQPYQTQD